MEEIIRIENDEMSIYEDLIIRKDFLHKEALHCEIKYIEEFGELISKAFEAKIECIRKKKIISYCQKILNKGGIINETEMENYISALMKDYYLQLEELLNECKEAKMGKSIGEYEVRKIKKIYYRIAKKIHPDMNPDLQDDETISDLWNRTLVAYSFNQLEELEELEVLVNRYLESIDYHHDDIDIPDIEEKIFRLNEEIDRIISSDPYLYKYLLSDAEAIKEKKEELNKEIKEYERYGKQLDDVISTFDIKRNYS